MQSYRKWSFCKNNVILMITLGALSEYVAMGNKVTLVGFGTKVGFLSFKPLFWTRSQFMFSLESGWLWG
jgi:hypothetical protein